jgi:hypothetical protein
MRFISIFFLFALSACTPKSQSLESAVDQSTIESISKRILITRSQCLALDGVEVGDIGDGRIHRPDYLCENQRPPLGTIRAESGEPIATEGSVCCGAD